jgi:hypothetical protein
MKHLLTLALVVSAACGGSKPKAEPVTPPTDVGSAAEQPAVPAPEEPAAPAPPPAPKSATK